MEAVVFPWVRIEPVYGPDRALPPIDYAILNSIRNNQRR